jgi:hypothetical protein
MTDQGLSHISNTPLRVAFVWRGHRGAEGSPVGVNNRLAKAADALQALGVQVEGAIFNEETIDDLRRQLLAEDGVLVWVDPLTDGRNRSLLDPLLRDLSAAGLFVSTHPDVILKMGVKEVLFRTRSIGWGVDTDLYTTFDDFAARFPARLASSGPRVLKQNRGNGGLGVWKVERISAEDTAIAAVRVLHARRGSVDEVAPLSEFMSRCADYFTGGGKIIDQAFQARLPEGMIRCYMSQNKVVGFGHQLIKALVSPPPGQLPEEPGPRIMHDAEAPDFQRLRKHMERDWVPAMQTTLGIATDALPVLWDADFLYGPQNDSGEDSYVLCEINVSAVSPFPESAAVPLAEAAKRLTLAARESRRD